MNDRRVGLRSRILDMRTAGTALRGWGRRRWLVASASALATVLVVAVPTAMITTPVFGRAVAVTPWAWPALLVTAVLSGLLVATYVREGEPASAGVTEGRAGALGGALTFFAVGCPVCNKLVLLALGYTGAIQWFAPVQPLLAVGAVALLGWALVRRLGAESSCRVPAAG